MTEYNEIEYSTDTEIGEIQDSRSGNYVLSIGHKVSKSDLERFIAIFLEKLND